jgi:hypothetical protein
MKGKSNFNLKTVVTLFVTVVIIGVSNNTSAQDRWSFEFRPGVNFATQKLGEANLNTGFGAEGTFSYRFMPHLSAYAGWSWNKFGSDQQLNGSKLDFEETGYSYGLQFIHPIGESKINYLIRAGGLANHIEVESGDEVIHDSGHGFGWQVEGGLAIPIGESWKLLPSVRYRSLSRDLTIETVSTPVDLTYLSVGLGISISF